MNRLPKSVTHRSGRYLLMVGTLFAIVGCSSNQAYDTAFSTKTALKGNSHLYAAPAGEVFNSVKISMIQQGFNIDEINSSQQLLKGMRTFNDLKNPQIAYLVTLTADVTAMSPHSTVLTAAATQKTVLNREIHKYYHLLGLVPIPTGREYQSVVRGEGNITGTHFYKDFFAAVSRNLTTFAKSGGPANAPATPPKRSSPNVAPTTKNGTLAHVPTKDSNPPR